MKLLTIILMLLPLKLFAFYDFIYPAGVCLKNEVKAGKRIEFEVATDKMAECCQVKQPERGSIVKGIYHVNSHGAKRTCQYRKVVNNKVAVLKKIPKRNVAATRGYGRTKFRFVKDKKS